MSEHKREEVIEAYQRGYPHVQRYKPETIISKTEEFFSTPRMKYFMSKDLPSRDDVAKLEGRGAKSGYYPALVIECYEYFNIPPVSVKTLTDPNTGEITLESTVNNGIENESWFKRDISINYLTFSTR